MDRKMVQYEIQVKGVTFENRQYTLQRMHGTEVMRLEPEPDNLYDPNAIAVKVAFPPEAGGGIYHVGYVPKELAAVIAPKLDGEPVMVERFDLTGGGYSYTGRPLTIGILLYVELPE